MARAFEVAWEFPGCLDQAPETTTVSDLPHERGLGSSAMAAGAIIRVVLDACRREVAADELFALTQMVEQIAHGKPSGLDAVATCSPCPTRFQGGQMRSLGQRIEDTSLIIADSGIYGSTREVVGNPRRRYESDPDSIGPCINRLGAFTQNTTMALGQADASALGATMDEVHAVLAEPDLSLPIFDDLIEAARSVGALGIKLTGGGLDGRVIALATGESVTCRVRAALEQAGAPGTWSYRMRISEMGE